MEGNDIEMVPIKERRSLSDAVTERAEADQRSQMRCLADRNKMEENKRIERLAFQAIDREDTERLAASGRQRAFDQRVKRPANVHISEFTKVRWKNLSVKMKCCMCLLTTVFAFMLIASIATAVMIPLVIINQQSSNELSELFDRLSDRITRANATLSAIENEVETVNGYTRVKADVFCMKDYFLSPEGAGARQRVVACLSGVINTSN